MNVPDLTYLKEKEPPSTASSKGAISTSVLELIKNDVHCFIQKHLPMPVGDSSRRIFSIKNGLIHSSLQGRGVSVLTGG